jgi:hypothetical protein
MDEILQFLLIHASFLYKEFGFRFVDSRVSSSFGGDAWLVLANETIRFRLVRDRGQLFGDFQEATSNSNAEWFSIDIVRQHLTGESQLFSELDSNNADFLRNRLSDIQQLFKQEVLSDTKKSLHKLEAKRAKQLFG